MMKLKSMALACLVIQTSSLVLCTRYSRKQGGERYLISTSVFFGELLKLIISVAVLLYQNNFSAAKVWQLSFGDMSSALKMSLPSFLYSVQSNLLFFALGNLQAAVYQVLYQTKILTTALFFVVMLGKPLSFQQWVALALLASGVVLANRGEMKPQTAAVVVSAVPEDNTFLGFVAVLCACCTSGFAGVYFEKVLKTTDVSLWVRNVQLCFFGSLVAFGVIFWQDAEEVRAAGTLLKGYNTLTYWVIFLQAAGGLVVAVVVKYADNVIKTFASALSIIASTVISYFVFPDTYISIQFAVGAFVAILATFLYSSKTEYVTAQICATSQKDRKGGHNFKTDQTKDAELNKV